MTLARNTFEGQTSGTNLTVALSATGGDSLTLVSPSNTTAMTYSNAQAKRGTSSIKVTTAATGTAFLMGITRTANNAFASAVDVYLTGYPTLANLTLLAHRTSSGGSASIAINSSNNKFVIFDAGGVIIATSAAVAPLNQWVHLDLRQVIGTGTTDGTIVWDVSAGGTSVFSGNPTNVNAGTTQLTEARCGKVTSGAAMPDFWMDDFTVDDGRTTLIGPAAASAAPTVSAGTNKTTTVGTAVQLTGTASGTVTYSWTLLSALGGAAATLTNANTATATVTPTAAGVLNYRLSATDTSSGGVGTADVTVYVVASPAAPIADTANIGAWTQTGGATAAATLADNSVSTYTQSPDNPSAPATERVRLAPLPTGTGFTLKVDHQLTAAGTGTATVTLYEGNIVRKVWTISPSTVLTTSTLTLTDSELSTIGSLNALDVEFAWNV
jgi:hypothetical protein